MSAKDLARQMLAQNLAPSVVAATIGVEPSYISQLMADEDFAISVEEARVKQTSEDLEYDEKLNSVESRFLERIEARVPMANLQQSLQAFRVLNGAKRRKERSQQPALINNGTIVNISLPQSVIPKYLTNSRNEIVEVEGQTMISATPKGLDEILQKKKPESTEESKMRLENQKDQRALVVLETVGPVKRRQQSHKAIFDVDML